MSAKVNMAQRAVLEDQQQSESSQVMTTVPLTDSSTLNEDKPDEAWGSRTETAWKSFSLTVKLNDDISESVDCTASLQPVKIQFLLTRQLKLVNKSLESSKYQIQMISNDVVLIVKSPDVHMDEVLTEMIVVLQDMTGGILTKMLPISETNTRAAVLYQVCKSPSFPKGSLAVYDDGRSILLVGEKSFVGDWFENLKKLADNQTKKIREISIPSKLDAKLLQKLGFLETLKDKTDIHASLDIKALKMRVDKSSKEDMDLYENMIKKFISDILVTECNCSESISILLMSKEVMKYMYSLFAMENLPCYITFNENKALVCYSRNKADGKRALTIMKTGIQTLNIDELFIKSTEFNAIWRARKGKCICHAPEEGICKVTVTLDVLNEIVGAMLKGENGHYGKEQKEENYSDGTQVEYIFKSNQQWENAQEDNKIESQEEIKTLQSEVKPEITVTEKPEQKEVKVEETVPNVENGIEDKVLVEEKNTVKTKVFMNNVEEETYHPKEPELKYKYKEDQWSPVYPEGKRLYDREFLLYLQHSSHSVIKPAGLPDLPEIILEPHTSNQRSQFPSDTGNREFHLPTGGFHFTPGFVRGSPRPGGSARRNRGGPSGQQKVISRVSVQQDVKLRKAEDAWKPTHKDDKWTEDPEAIKSERQVTIDENCVICMDKIENPKWLPCKHVFCTDCIDQHFKFKPACPQCGSVHGKLTGDQPPGTMTTIKQNYSLPGYSRCRTIAVTYTFPPGNQTEEHPNPGKFFTGIERTGYLPDNEKGRLVAKLLKIAFDRRLVFTIRTSRTTGHEGVITWNDIHHKTGTYGGLQSFGYPDDTYLDRVLDELSAKGVTEESIDDP